MRADVPIKDEFRISANESEAIFQVESLARKPACMTWTTGPARLSGLAGCMVEYEDGVKGPALLEQEYLAFLLGEVSRCQDQCCYSDSFQFPKLCNISLWGAAGGEGGWWYFTYICT